MVKVDGENVGFEAAAVRRRWFEVPVEARSTEDHAIDEEFPPELGESFRRFPSF
jgi:hypothetical protein